MGWEAMRMKPPDEIKAELMKEIQEASAYFEDPPRNEANTCAWVIRPLLEKAGYARREIVERESDAAGKYPDYTILPGTSYTWYLEAKAWQGELRDDRDLHQALNYAHSNGSRWVVLTNGREWRLYDDYIREPDARLVAQSNLRDSDFLDLMLALSRASVQAGRLEQFANRSRLKGVLLKELADADGPLLKALSNKLRNSYGLESVQPEDVAAYFAELTGSQAAGVREDQRASEAQEEPSMRAGSEFSLLELRVLGKRVWNNKPKALVVPDGLVVDIDRWVDLASEALNWLAARRRLPPVPFRGLRGGHRWFLNSTPTHENGDEMTYRTAEVDGQTIYMDVHRSSSNMVKCLCALCEAAGVPPSGFVVTLKNPVE
jgi:hypothetical protein